MYAGATAGSTEVEALAANETGLDPQAAPFQLADWTVDPQLNQIRHRQSGETRHLEPRLAKLLCHLAAHQGKVVERDSLVTLLWPRVIVNENSLTRAVSELRKQLTVAAETKTIYIETIPKRGYRLVVPVTVPASAATISAAAANQEAGQVAWPPAFLQSFTRLHKSAPAAFVLTLALTFLLHLDSLSRQPEPVSFSDEIVSATDGTVLGGEFLLSDAGSDDKLSAEIGNVLLSRDENRFAYVQYDHTGSTIMLGEVGALESDKSITEGTSEYQPTALYNSKDVLFNLAWSPIGDALLFASKPAMNTAAWFDPKLKPTAKLYSLDLNTLEVSLLVEQAPAEVQTVSTELSLT